MLLLTCKALEDLQQLLEFVLEQSCEELTKFAAKFFQVIQNRFRFGILREEVGQQDGNKLLVLTLLLGVEGGVVVVPDPLEDHQLVFLIETLQYFLELFLGLRQGVYILEVLPLFLFLR